jgi:EAL domain-containing protein (putative c-di-GMP-specific phosphodiesterase class I)
LIHDFAKAFQRYAHRHDMALTGRLSGADFAVLIPSKAVSQEALSAFYQSVLAAVSPLLAGVTSTWVVGAVFKPGTAKENVLSQLEIAMAELEMQDTNNCRWIDASLALADDAPLPLNTQDWQQVFDDALLHRRLELASFAVTNFKGGLLHQECAMRLRMHADGKWLPAGEFWPMVERLRCTARFDLAGVRLGLAKLVAEPDLPGVAVNISGNSLMQSEFLPELLSVVQAHPQAHRLWLEVSEATAFAHFEAVAKLVAALKPARCKLGIEHFSKHFGRLGQLQQLGLDYLKLDASLVQQLEANTGNQTLLKGVLWIARNMGMMVVAQGVRRAEELETLANLGFDGATGPWIKSPRPSGPSQ